ncbi:MAG: hypothetical protein KDE34_16650 [Anaerolineales bacterium]|nr:hypothetical protein [Anaerolineales bacterium]
MSSTIKVNVTLPDGRTVDLTLPADVAMLRLTRALAARLGLPALDEQGDALFYELAPAGQPPLADTTTLAQARLPAGAHLILTTRAVDWATPQHEQTRAPAPRSRPRRRRRRDNHRRRAPVSASRRPVRVERSAAAPPVAELPRPETTSQHPLQGLGPLFLFLVVLVAGIICANNIFLPNEPQFPTLPRSARNTPAPTSSQSLVSSIRGDINAAAIHDGYLYFTYEGSRQQTVLRAALPDYYSQLTIQRVLQLSFVTEARQPSLVPLFNLLFFYNSRQQLWLQLNDEQVNGRQLAGPPRADLPPVPLGANVAYEAMDENSGKRLLFLQEASGVTHKTDAILAENWHEQALVNDDFLYFAARSELTGTELWRTDGTPEGTFQLADLVPSTGSSNPANLVIWQDQIFFSLSTADGSAALGRTDGTSAGTRIVTGFADGGMTEIRQIHTLPAHLILLTKSRLGYHVVWQTDTNGAAPRELFVLNSSLPIEEMVVGEDKIYVLAKYADDDLMLAAFDRATATLNWLELAPAQQQKPVLVYGESKLLLQNYPGAVWQLDEVSGRFLQLALADIEFLFWQTGDTFLLITENSEIWQMQFEGTLVRRIKVY